MGKKAYLRKSHLSSKLKVWTPLVVISAEVISEAIAHLHVLFRKKLTFTGERAFIGEGIFTGEGTFTSNGAFAGEEAFTGEGTFCGVT